MDVEAFAKTHAEFENTGFPGLCDRRDENCSPSTLATQYVKFSEKEIYLYCDTHAPKDAVALHPSKIDELLTPLPGPLPGPAPGPSAGFAKLRSMLSSQLGIRLESTGARAIPGPLTQVILQTLDASPENPYEVEFRQHILDPFTGPGQFDLAERDSIRRSFGGASAGGTPVLTDDSGVMNWQPGDVDKIIQVGRKPGRYYRILSRESSTQVTLSANITLPSIELTLTMDGEIEVTIATKDGFPDGETPRRLVKLITSDKVYSVVFVPGTAGDGIFSASARSLYGGFIDPDPTPLPT